MNGLQGLGAAIVKFLWKIAVAIILLVFVAALVSWARGNPRQAQATTNKVMNAGASVIGWTADGITGMTGGQAAHDGPAGVETIWVENTAPLRWQVGRAIKVWNKGLVGVQLKAGPCQPGAQCIKVTQERLDTPPGESLLLGQTRGWMNKSVHLNSAAVNHVPASHFAYASCHEVGHALRVPHNASKASCMYASAAGAALSPAPEDYAAVNAEYGH